MQATYAQKQHVTYNIILEF